MLTYSIYAPLFLPRVPRLGGARYVFQKPAGACRATCQGALTRYSSIERPEQLAAQTLHLPIGNAQGAQAIRRAQ
jgi:hypothetical protein